MDDIRQRDFSDIPEGDLTPAERHEIRRRFEEFVQALGHAARSGKGAKQKKKKVLKWDPAVHGRKH